MRNDDVSTTREGSPKVTKFYLEELEVTKSTGRFPRYDRLLTVGFVFSVIAIVTGVALHIAEYSMRADPNGE